MQGQFVDGPKVIGRVQILMLDAGGPVPQVQVTGDVPGGIAGVELMLGSARVLLLQQLAQQQRGGIEVARPSPNGHD